MDGLIQFTMADEGVGDTTPPTKCRASPERHVSYIETVAAGASLHTQPNVHNKRIICR